MAMRDAVFLSSVPSSLRRSANSTDSFGPLTTVYTGRWDTVDFTPEFEDAILTLAPLAVGTFLLSVQVAWKLWRRPPRKVGELKGALFVTKLLLYVLLVVLQTSTVTVLMLLQQPASETTSALAYAAEAVSMACAFVLAASALLYDLYSVRCSSISQAILGWWALTDIVRIRSQWLRPTGHVFAVLMLLLLIVKLSLIFTEEKSKRSSLRGQYARWPPEALSGIYNRLFLVWINPLMLRGVRGVPFTLSELWKLEECFSSDSISARMDALWDRYFSKRKGPHLFVMLLWEYKSLTLFPIPTRVAQAALSFAQPFLIQRTLAWYNTPVNAHSNTVGYGLLGAFAVVYIGIAVTTAFGQYQIVRFITALRGSLITLIYRKTLEMKISAKQNLAPITHMGTDVEQIAQGLQYLHESLISFVTFGIALWLLERQLGVGAIAPIAMAIFTAAIIGSFGSQIGKAQKRWVDAVERRVAVTTHILTNMKTAKMSGLMGHLARVMQTLRTTELKISLSLRRFLTVAVGLSFATPQLAPVLAFGVYVATSEKHGQTLLDEKAFTILSYLTLASTPLNVLIQTLPAVIGAYSCFSRINDFLRDKSSVNAAGPVASSAPADAIKRMSLHFWFQDGEQTSLRSSHYRPSGALPGYRPAAKDALTISDCTLTRSPESSAVLHNLNIRVPHSSMTLIVGPSGCGKSTLLNALLGEIPVDIGSITFSGAPGNIAYCAQVPWLRNDSVQSNILNGLPYNHAWYCAVLFACTLEKDSEALFAKTVGHGGSTLSGGQRQKVALARALYSKTELVIIDEPFTGIDSASRHQMVDRIFGPDGILRQTGLTVVVATHSTKYIRLADHVVVLGSNGHIVEQGYWDELHVAKSATQDPGSQTAATLAKENLSNTVNPCAYALATQDEVAGANPVDRRKGELEAYKYYFRSLGWWKLGVAFALVVGFSFFTVFPQIWVQWWTNSNVDHPNNRPGWWLGWYAAFGLIGLASLTLASWLMLCDMVRGSAAWLHHQLVKTVERAPMTTLSAVDPGITINRFSQDMSLVDMELPFAFANTMILLTTSLAQVAVIVASSKYLAVALPFVALVCFGIQRLYLRTSRQLRLLDIEAKAPLYSQFIETVNGLATIRAYGSERRLRDETAEILDTSQKPFYLLLCVQRYLGLVLNLTNAGLALLLIGVSTLTRGKSGNAYLGVALINIMTFGTSLTDLVDVWCTLEVSLAAVERVKHFSTHTPAETTPVLDMVFPDWPQEGAVVIRDLSVGYKPNSAVLKNLNLSIAAGEKIAICGPSGSGKSTLCSSLFRMLELSSGSIAIDGQPISRVSHDTLRRSISAVPQDPFVLTGTLRANLDPDEDSPDFNLVQVLQKVGLWEKFRDKKQALEVQLDQDTLSAGEKQLLCLARALLRKRTVLVLDESTSGVDVATDKALHELVCEELPQTTVISVMHRLDQVHRYDRVAVLIDGGLAEVGTPKDLLRDGGSVFSQLFAHATED